MDCPEIISGIKKFLPDFNPVSLSQNYPDEVRIKVKLPDFKNICLTLHKLLPSPIRMLFAGDERKKNGNFALYAVLANLKKSQWVIVTADIAQENPCFDSLSRDMHSANLFEREIWEMFGLKPSGHPDLRRLKLHDEVWPEGNYPLRNDFQKNTAIETGFYKFSRIEGEGIFEVPVGPVHAGIIGPGHFRFSTAGEPIINLEIRLGFTHRGAEKLFEGKFYEQGIRLSECISGDSAFAHSLAFAVAAEKISGCVAPDNALILRTIFLELERIYNHVNGIGGIAVDAGFSFPAAYASLIKEATLQLNEKLTGSRYLKNIITVGGVLKDVDDINKKALIESVEKIERDFKELVKILNKSVSFMDRVDTTGVLKRKTADDFGVCGPAGRSSGIHIDLRKYFPGVYKEAKFKMATQEPGDVLSRLKVRILEFEESCRLIRELSRKLVPGGKLKSDIFLKEGSALGYAEGWRGPVLYWLKTDSSGRMERCKIVDPSFLNWPALSYAVLGNIIPDFPLCNKSFDLSYSGNDL